MPFGAIGKSMIAMHLHRMGEEYHGYYYYDKTKHPIYMLGNDTIAGKGKVRLFAYSPGNPESNEIFTVTLAGNKQEGLEKGGE